MKLDLHMHSTASDGQYSPSELIALGKEKELEVIALTDHDTIDGIEEAANAAKNMGVRFVPGIEISTMDQEEVHILGLGIDCKNQKLVEATARFKYERDNRADIIIKYLDTKGINVQKEYIKKLAGDGVIGRPHFAKYLIEKGYVKSVQAAFDRYLDTKEFHEATDRKLPSCEEAIDLIHEAGGAAFIAHPALLKMSKLEQDQLICRLIKGYGLDGIECFYYKHTPKQTKRFLSIAIDCGVKISCGSDFHGEKVKPEVPLGMVISDEYRELLSI